MSCTRDLAEQLIARPSVTPNDCGCQELLAQRLSALGFKCEHLRFGEVDNLWARYGDDAPLLVFAGHTDVVPAGNPASWHTPPFEPLQRHGMLFGRGAADMKGGIAAFVTATERFFAAQPRWHGSLAFLLTSDEEGEAIDGTVKVLQVLAQRGDKITWCLLGEPSSVTRVGDEAKNGRRGSLNGHLTIHGIQGHVAYPHLADNPIHRFAPVLHALCSAQWDQGNAFFPPTSFQISNIIGGTGAVNVIPGELQVRFNFRYSSEVTHHDLQTQVKDLLDRHALNYSITWEHSGYPFLTQSGELISAAQQAVAAVCGYECQLSTSGGTSDGRFIAPTGAQVLELGLLNATIHKANEGVSIADLDTLSLIYEKILFLLLVKD
jgi:succinyl-diaminopimelate desuccinylase